MLSLPNTNGIKRQLRLCSFHPLPPIHAETLAISLQFPVLFNKMSDGQILNPDSLSFMAILSNIKRATDEGPVATLGNLVLTLLLPQIPSPAFPRHGFWRDIKPIAFASDPEANAIAIEVIEVRVAGDPL